MNDLNRMEYLCPHCLSANQIERWASKDSKQQRVRCANCFSEFEIIIAKGLNGEHNIIVEDISR